MSQQAASALSHLFSVSLTFSPLPYLSIIADICKHPLLPTTFKYPPPIPPRMQYKIPAPPPPSKFSPKGPLRHRMRTFFLGRIDQRHCELGGGGDRGLPLYNLL